MRLLRYGADGTDDLASSKTISGCGIVRVLLGALLLAAAGLKAHQLATEPVAERDLLTSRTFLTVWVELELFLGAWFLSGLFRRAAWAAAMNCFFLFAIVAAARAFAGETSCGCFGRIEVSPWYTLVLDSGALAALVLFRPDLRTPIPASHRRLRAGLVAAIVLAAGVPAAILASRYEPAVLSSEGEIVGEESVVLLEPETWVEKPCPILSYIDVGRELARGEWIVVLYHYDCPHCQERVPEFDRKARAEAELAGIARTAMVDLPPHAPPGRSLLPPDSPCVRGLMSAERDWFVETPVTLVLKEGIVVGAAEEAVSLPLIQAGPATDVAPRGETAIPPSHEERHMDKVTSGPEALSPPSPAPSAPAIQPIEGATARPPPTEKAVPLSAEGYDFGYVELKSTHEVILAVPNPSAKALRISKVKSECKCMKAAVLEETIAPGQAVSVKVDFVAPDKAMHYDKRVALVTDDPEHALILVRIKADVGLPLESIPPTLDLGTVLLGETREGNLVIVNRSQRPARLLYSTSSAEDCVLKVPRDPVPAEGSLSVSVTVGGRLTGPQKAVFQIATDVETQPSLTVPVEFVVAPKAQGSREAAAGHEKDAADMTP